MLRGFQFVVGGLIAAGLAAGCDSGAVNQGAVEFKETDTSQFDTMKNEMLEGMKTKNYNKKPTPPKDAGASAAKPAEGAPAAK